MAGITDYPVLVVPRSPHTDFIDQEEEGGTEVRLFRLGAGPGHPEHAGRINQVKERHACKCQAPASASSWVPFQAAFFFRFSQTHDLRTT